MPHIGATTKNTLSPDPPTRLLKAGAQQTEFMRQVFIDGIDIVILGDCQTLPGGWQLWLDIMGGGASSAESCFTPDGPPHRVILSMWGWEARGNGRQAGSLCNGRVPPQTLSLVVLFTDYQPSPRTGLRMNAVGLDRWTTGLDRWFFGFLSTICLGSGFPVISFWLGGGFISWAVLLF